MNSKNDSVLKLEEVFTRGVREVFDPDGKVREKIQKKLSGEYTSDIIVKFGMDPTRPDIHLGHAVVLRKLRSLQDLGCKVVFLVGDFTAQIGDPTGKDKTRPDIEQKEVDINMRTYLEQAGKILRTDKKHFSWIRNSEWFYNVTDLASPKEIKMNVKINGKVLHAPIEPKSFVGKAAYFESTRMQKTHLKKRMIVGVSLRTLLSTLKRITHSRLIERDMFQNRIKDSRELFMHEMLYPVLQGIDSVMIEKIYGSCDLEVGGSDQTFNMLLGRDVMKMNHTEPQAVISFELLIGTDGKEKMSKSLDNYIGITDTPSDMYGEIMSIPDSMIVSYFELCTYSPMEVVRKLQKTLKGKGNPRDIKMRLAREIVSIYHGEKSAQDAQNDFIQTFQNKGIPENIETEKVKKGTLLVEILLKKKFVKSKTEFRRLISNNAISVDVKKITDADFKIQNSIVVKIGKKRFLRIETL